MRNHFLFNLPTGYLMGMTVGYHFNTGDEEK